MRKAIWVGALITGLLALASVGPGWLMRDTSHPQEGSTCKVRSQTCQWTIDGNRWQVKLDQADSVVKSDLERNERLQISVRTNATAQRLTAVLVGESMYMGKYPIALHRQDEQPVWRAEFAPPVCTVDPSMTWRIELWQGQTPIIMPVKLIFHASVD